MYVWKCWRDSRTSFIGYLIALHAICIFLTVTTVWADPAAMQTGILPTVAQLWSKIAEMVLGVVASFFALICGWVLGSAGLGEEFAERTADFLLTRPRRRKYWVWICWSVGLCELGAIVFLAVVVTFGILTYLTGHIHTWWLLGTILPLTVGGAVIYGLTYFLTIVSRSGQQGLRYSMGISAIALLLPAPVRYYWKVSIPSIMGFMSTACESVVRASVAFPTGALVLWTVVALAFPIAAQLVLERMET